MKNILVCVLLAVIIAAVIVLTVDVHRTIADIRRTDGLLDVVLADADGAVGDLRTVVQDVQVSAKQLSAAGQEQRAYWLKTSQQTADAMRDIRQLAARLDRSVNDHMIPTIDGQVTATGTAAGGALASLQHAGDSLDARLRDPQIAQMAENLNRAAAGVAAASDHTAQATEHLEKATADIETKVHQLTRPPSLAKRIGMGLLDVGAKLGSIAAGFVK